MNEDKIKELAKEEFINNVMTNLDSTLIFTYIRELEKENVRLKDLIKEYQPYFKGVDMIKLIDGEKDNE